MKKLEEETGGPTIGTADPDTGDSTGNPPEDQDNPAEEHSQASHEEDRIEELESALQQAVETIARLEQELEQAQRAQDLERLLIEAGVVDLETAMVLAEQRLKGSDATVEEVVSDLASSKSFLFRAKPVTAAASALSEGRSSSGQGLTELADEARRTGDRRAVLRYLRRRRG